MVAIIIVHYQNLEDTLRCVESLEQSDYQDFKIIIVDNCSPNQTGEQLQRKLTECEVILSKKNNGFAAACNIGIHASIGADYIWLLNPDTTVKADALTKLVEAANKHPKITAYGSKILYGDNPKKIWSAGACVNLKSQTLKMIGNNEIDIGQFVSNSDCDYLPGCSIFAKKDVFKTTLPEKYFMYFEETDWCFSMRLEGKKLMYVADSVVFHHTKDEKMHSAFNVYYYNRNQLFFWYKFSTPLKKISLLTKVTFKILPRNCYAFYKAPLLSQKEIFKAHIFSNLDFLFNRFGKRY